MSNLPNRINFVAVESRVFRKFIQRQESKTSQIGFSEKKKSTVE